MPKEPQLSERGRASLRRKASPRATAVRRRAIPRPPPSPARVVRVGGGQAHRIWPRPEAGARTDLALRGERTPRHGVIILATRARSFPLFFGGWRVEARACACAWTRTYKQSTSRWSVVVELISGVSPGHGAPVPVESVCILSRIVCFVCSASGGDGGGSSP